MFVRLRPWIGRIVYWVLSGWGLRGRSRGGRVGVRLSEWGVSSRSLPLCHCMGFKSLVMVHAYYHIAGSLVYDVTRSTVMH